MHRNALENGFELIASEGMELVVISEGLEIARTKRVIVPEGITFNEWVEVDEIIVEPEIIQEPTNEDKIVELERQIAELKGKQYE